MTDKQIHNMKINRVTFLVAGIIFVFFGLFFIPFLVIGGLLIFLAHKTNKTYKKSSNKPEEVKPPVIEKVVKETVRVTDIDGSVRELSIYLTLDQANRVLVAEGGKTFHTHLNCFKNWKPEMTENFTGWKIIKKSEAISNGMRYCNFCEDKDKIPDTDMDDLEEYESEYEEE